MGATAGTLLKCFLILASTCLILSKWSPVVPHEVDAAVVLKLCLLCIASARDKCRPIPYGVQACFVVLSLCTRALPCTNDSSAGPSACLDADSQPRVQGRVEPQDD